MDTEAEEAFDRLARLAAALLGTPLAFVTVVDAERSWYKSFVGGPEGAPRWGPVEASFCKYVIGEDAECIIGDARADPLTWSNPAIKRMGVAAWAGYPVRAPGGEVLGTFCVVDTVPRTWSAQDLTTLRTLAAAATAEIALRRVADLTDDTADRADLRTWLLDSVLDWSEQLVADQSIPATASVRAPEHGIQLRPDLVLLDVEDPNKARLGVFVWPLGSRLDS